MQEKPELDETFAKPRSGLGETTFRLLHVRLLAPDFRPHMDHQGINVEAIAALHGVSHEEARELIDESFKETRQAAEAFLASHPELLKEFEAEYDRDTAFREQRGLAVQERNGFLRGCALGYELRQRLGAQGKKIKASDVAASCNGELPPGWDDLLPPESIENDINP